MGPKTSNKSEIIKAHKCGLCGISFASAPALASHSQRIHLNFFKQCVVPITDNKRVAILRKGAITEEIKPKAEIMPKKRVIRTEMDFKKDIHFACPKCERLFKSYFSARQHIVRYHLVNDKDEPVSETSPDLIKPIPRERCLKCQVNINSDDIHICSLTPEDFTTIEQFACLGCNQSFQTIKLFDIHVPGLHCDGIETMFFQTLDDLLEWVSEIEDTTDATFKLMNYTSSKQIYRCTYLSDKKDSNHISMCPSSIHILEFTKGFQVNFYTRHHGHNSKVYQTNERFKKNLISSFLKDSDKHKDKTSDPQYNYNQLKKILEKVILKSAMINPKHLTNLMDMAVEMDTALKTYEETELVNTSCDMSNLNDSQITDALQDTEKSRRKKRKGSLSPIPHVEMEVVENVPLQTRSASKGKRKLPLIVDSFSLNEKNDVKKEKKLILTKTRFLDTLSDSPSFNDTYKDFIGKTCIETTPISTKRPKKPIVKTKMGQFKPNSPKKATPLPDVKVKPSPKKATPLPDVKVKPSPKKATPLPDVKVKPSPKKATPLRDVKVKQVQPAKPESPVHFNSLPKDISYEIKEQENDYNILILKL